MRTNKKNRGSSHDSESKSNKRTLRFVCPECGGRELRVFLVRIASYPDILIDKVIVDPDHLESEENVAVFEKIEDEDLHSKHEYFWHHVCANKSCEALLAYEEDGETWPVQNRFELARWLLENCPQEDEDGPVTEEEPKS